MSIYISCHFEVENKRVASRLDKYMEHGMLFSISVENNELMKSIPLHNFML